LRPSDADTRLKLTMLPIDAFRARTPLSGSREIVSYGPGTIRHPLHVAIAGHSGIPDLREHAVRRMPG
jgi:hypothetical protein